MQTATNPTPTRKRGDRVRGYIIRDFALLQNTRRPTPNHYLKLIEVATYWVDEAMHDAGSVIQYRAQETDYQRPPVAMQQLAKGIAQTFGCLWFEESQQQPLGPGRRWYHYGGSSRLRVWAAMFVFEKTWKAADRFAHYELMKSTIPEDGARRTYVTDTRAEWVARLCEYLPEREIEPWVVQEWKLARSKARARGTKHNRQPPRSMSYEDVARWLDDVIGSWQL